MKIFNGKGHIAGLPEGSLFNDFDTKWWWNAFASIKFEILDRTVSLATSIEGFNYNVMGKEIKKNYYSCSLFYNSAEIGKLFFWAYTNGEGCVITGSWEEEGYTYELWGKFQWEI